MNSIKDLVFEYFKFSTTSWTYGVLHRFMGFDVDDYDFFAPAKTEGLKFKNGKFILSKDLENQLKRLDNIFQSNFCDRENSYSNFLNRIRFPLGLLYSSRVFEIPQLNRVAFEKSAKDFDLLLSRLDEVKNILLRNINHPLIGDMLEDQLTRGVYKGTLIKKGESFIKELGEMERLAKATSLKLKNAGLKATTTETRRIEAATFILNELKQRRVRDLRLPNNEKSEFKFQDNYLKRTLNGNVQIKNDSFLVYQLLQTVFYDETFLYNSVGFINPVDFGKHPLNGSISRMEYFEWESKRALESINEKETLSLIARHIDTRTKKNLISCAYDFVSESQPMNLKKVENLALKLQETQAGVDFMKKLFAPKKK